MKDASLPLATRLRRTKRSGDDRFDLARARCRQLRPPGEGLQLIGGQVKPSPPGLPPLHGGLDFVSPATGRRVHARLDDPGSRSGPLRGDGGGSAAWLVLCLGAPGRRTQRRALSAHDRRPLDRPDRARTWECGGDRKRFRARSVPSRARTRPSIGPNEGEYAGRTRAACRNRTDDLLITRHAAVRRTPSPATVPQCFFSSEAIGNIIWHRLRPGTAGHGVTRSCAAPPAACACHRHRPGCPPPLGPTVRRGAGPVTAGQRIGRYPAGAGGWRGDREGVQAVLVPAGAR